MKVSILPSALDDLAEGFLFYENQGENLGNYFLDSLFSDIDSLKIYGGIHRQVFGFHRALSKRFPFAIYYGMERITFSSVPSWIAGATPNGSAKN